MVWAIRRDVQWVYQPLWHALSRCLEGRHGSRHGVGDCSAVTVVGKESELNETVVLGEEYHW